METQAIPSAEARSMESIESFGPNTVEDIVKDILTTPKATQKKQNNEDVEDVGRLECECGVPVRFC
jgi:hypothetical protein